MTIRKASSEIADKIYRRTLLLRWKATGPTLVALYNPDCYLQTAQLELSKHLERPEY